LQKEEFIMFVQVVGGPACCEKNKRISMRLFKGLLPLLVTLAGCSSTPPEGEKPAPEAVEESAAKQTLAQTETSSKSNHSNGNIVQNATPRKQFPARGGIELQPLYSMNVLSGPLVLPSLAPAVVFVGRDFLVTEKLGLRPEDAVAREAEIHQLEVSLKSLPADSSQAMGVGTRLLLLYKSHAVYLEYLWAMRLSDRAYPNLAHFMKVANSMIIVHSQRLMGQFNKVTMYNEWLGDSLIARIKIGDQSAYKSAAKFVFKEKGSVSIRLRLVAIAHLYLTGVKNSAFGTVESALALPMDAPSQSVMAMLAAEEIDGTKFPEKARQRYLESVKNSRFVMAPDGGAGPVFDRSVGRLIQIAVATQPQKIDTKLLEMLLYFKRFDYARNYSEQVALANRSANHAMSVKLYQELLTYAPATAPYAMRCQARMLDLALTAKDIPLLEQRWNDLIKSIGNYSVVGLDPRVTATQNLIRVLAERQPIEANYMPLTRLHDSFRKQFPEYAKNEEWDIALLKVLKQSKNSELLASRADSFKGTAGSSENKMHALRFAISARQRMLGLQESSEWKPREMNANSKVTAGSYVSDLKALASGSSHPEEAERALYQAAYTSHLMKQTETSLSTTEQAFVKYPQSAQAPLAASYFIGAFGKGQDDASLERTLRLVLAHKVSPAAQEHKNPKILLEDTVFLIAKNLQKKKSFEEAAAKYAAFQEEFPSSRNAPVALKEGSESLIQAQRKDKALQLIELLVETYPNSALAMEARWKAAELALSEQQTERAADHFALFAAKHTTESISRKAWLLAGRAYEKASNVDKAIESYKSFAAQTTHITDKINGLQEAARLYLGKGAKPEATASYEQMVVLAQSAGADKNVDVGLWAQLQIVEIQIGNGQTDAGQDLAQKIIKQKPNSAEGMGHVAKAKFLLGEIEAVKVRKTIGEQNFVVGHEELMTQYQHAQELYLSVCEVPGRNWCSAAYYEAGELAKSVLDAFKKVTWGATEPGESDPIRTSVTGYSSRLQDETEVFARKMAEAYELGGAPTEAYKDKMENRTKKVTKANP
jgi:tetratricopeptide (TPR) repeat protein